MMYITQDFQTGILRYVHADHLGSSSVETNSSGGESASRTYYAYGSTRSSSGTLQTDRTFTGQKQDGTGLHYYNARYYDSVLGVFLSPDTLVPDAGRVVDYNRFLYVRGNPLRFSDPTGHLSEDEIRNYYGYEGDDRDALRQAMLDDGWNENLANWLLNPDIHFGDTFTYSDSNGVNGGVVMLALFESGERRFTGGFYGLSGQYAGQRVSRDNIDSFSDDTPEAVRFKMLYAGQYSQLPRRTGVDGRNYYDPATALDYDGKDLVGVGVTALGVTATAAVAAGCLSNPAGWVACMGGGPGLISAGTTLLGGIITAVNPPGPTAYPILMNSGRLVGNAPVHRSLNPPKGAYE